MELVQLHLLEEGTAPAAAPRGNWVAGALTLLALGVALAAGLATLQPPNAVPWLAPDDSFASERAMRHMVVIASQPHPMGSAAHAAVEKYLVDQLSALGMDPHVQATTALAQDLEKFGGQRYAGRAYAATVHNVVARLPGTASTGALLLVGHYDSMPTTPGAADGASGVAAILETLRALKASPALKNDVIVLFTDADVPGRLGARAFVDGHAWGREAAIVVKFEAIGTSGPAALVSTSRENGWVLAQLRKALPHPLVLMPFNDVAERFGGGSEDVAELTRHGGVGLAFASFGGTFAYHTVLDAPRRIDERTLQHDGASALALVRHFGSLPLKEVRAPEAAAFNVGKDRVASYPAMLARPIALGLTLLLAGLLALGLSRGRLDLGSTLLGAVASLAVVVLAVCVSGAAGAFVTWLNARSALFLQGPYRGTLLLVGVVLLALAVVAAGEEIARRRVKRLASGPTLAAGALAWPWAASLVTAVVLPAFNPFLAWPLLFALVALAIVLFGRKGPDHPWSRAAAIAVGAVPAIILVTPVVAILWAIAHRFPTTLPRPMAAVPLALVALLALPVVALRALGARRYLVPALLGIAALGFLAASFVTSRFSPTHPRPDHVAYVLDADANAARWVSAGEKLDTFTSAFFPGGGQRTTFAASPGFFPDRAFPAIQTPAPLLPLAPPSVTVVEDTTASGVRTVRLKIVSSRAAPNVEVEVVTAGEIVSGSVEGLPLDRSGVVQKDRFWLMRYALPPEGIEIALSVRPSAPLRVVLTDITSALPDIPNAKAAFRPTDTMPAPHDFGDATMVRKTTRI